MPAKVRKRPSGKERRVPFLLGKRLMLRPLRKEDASGPYLEWFNDSAVCAGNGHHFFPYTAQDALQYIQRAHSSQSELILAIAKRQGDQHIGNIALKRINTISRTAELAIVIGDKNSWGKGYSKEAARLLLDHAFFALNLNRVYCGTFESNQPMRRLARFLCMKEEGRRRQATFKQNRYLDIIEYGVLRREYSLRFGGPP